MAIWYVLALWLALVGYQGGKKVIREKYNNAGVYGNGIFKRPDRLYHEGEAAVAVGRLKIIFSIALELAVLTEILGLHDSSLEMFIFLLVISNIITTIFYPAKRKSYYENKFENES